MRARVQLAAIVGGALLVMGSVALQPAAAQAPDQIVLTGTARDFDHAPKVNAGQAHPDFEGVLGDDLGIVAPDLGSDGKPVYGNHAETPTTHGPAAFDQWFHDAPGVNVGVPVSITATKVAGSSPATYTFANPDFFPLDGQGWNAPGVGDGVGQVDLAHNFSFTFELHLTFTYGGGETFQFTGDDDLFVFVNRKLALDLGGVHAAEDGTIDLDAQAAALGLTVGQTYPFDLFFAERHTSSSSFAFETTLQLSSPATTTTTATTLATSTTRAPGATATTSTTAPRHLAVTGTSSQPLLVVGLLLLGVGLILLGESQLARPTRRW